jgi:hypothetical protein
MEWYIPGRALFLEVQAMNKALTLLLTITASVIGDTPFAPGLPNGFELVKPNSYQHSICNPDRVIVIPPRIIEMTVIGNKVLGRSELPPLENLKKGAIAGFFFLDTASGERFVGLSKEEYDKILKNHGIKIEPALIPVETP